MGILSEMAEWRKGWRESSGYACVSKPDLEVLLKAAELLVRYGPVVPDGVGDDHCRYCLEERGHASDCEYVALEEKLTGPRMDKGA